MDAVREFLLERAEVDVVALVQGNLKGHPTAPAQGHHQGSLGMDQLRLPGSVIRIFSAFWDPVGGIFLLKIWIPKKIWGPLQDPYPFWDLEPDSLKKFQK